MRTILGQPLALAAGIAAGLHGAGAWALVVQQVVASMAGFILMAMWFRPWPALRLDRPALRELWRVAGPQVLALVVMTARYRAFILVLGVVSSELVVAVTHVAFRMVDVAGAIVASAIGRLAGPRLAALQENHNALAESFGMLSRWQALGGLPVALGLAVVAPQLIGAMMGPAWASAGPPAQVLGVSAALWIVCGPVMALWLAIGRTRMNLIVQALACALPVVLLAVLRPQSPAVAALCWASAALVLPGWQLHLALRALRRGWRWMLRWLAPTLWAASVMLVAALAVQRVSANWPAVYAVAAISASGALAWAAAVAVWWLRQPDNRDWLSMASVSASAQD
jgi:PST family polysaccharide transporter